jgi:sugar diacid utilization regulator
MLPDVAALMWATIQVVTAALAEAHSEVTRALQADQITLRHRLVTLLQAGVTDEETAQIASALRFDPYGDFIAVSSSAVATPDSDGLAALRTRLDALPGTAICAHNGATVVILSQRNKVPALTAAIRRVRPDSSLAIGLRRPAIGGAAASLRDSQRVLATIEQARSVSRFEDHWLHAILLASADELSSLVESKLSVVRTNPHLVEAVRAFAEHDLSATGAARAMDLHPNTTMYRLARWQNLTGWDPRTFRGLTLSLLATWISGAEACEETDD